MGERTVNWLVYTCMIGLVPVLVRLFVWQLANRGVEAVAISDLVAFGLVLHTSNLHEINSGAIRDNRWKSINNGVSALFITLYGVILLATILAVPKIDYNGLKNWSIVMSIVSFTLSFSVFYERSSASKANNKEVGRELV